MLKTRTLREARLQLILTTTNSHITLSLSVRRQHYTHTKRYPFIRLRAKYVVLTLSDLIVVCNNSVRRSRISVGNAQGYLGVEGKLQCSRLKESTHDMLVQCS